MKILVFSNNYIGLHSFRKEVFKTILDAGHEIIISAPFDDKREYFDSIGCRVINTQFNRKGMNPIKDLCLLFSYCRLLKQIKPEVVLSYTIKPNIYGGMACQIYGVPQIANITGLGSAVENPGWLQKLTIVLYKIALRKTKTVFFQNKANMHFCIQHKMTKGHIMLIPGSGVNLDFHSLQAYPEKSPIKFVFISRLIKEKGIEEYFAAAESIKEKYPDTEFHIVGWCEDAYLNRLEKLEKNHIVKYHGAVGDVRPYIGAAHCTVHPSFYPEGMSNVLLESCAAGRPIITTNRPGCGEIVDDGINGYVVRQQDTDDLIVKIENFIALPYNKKHEMGLAARKKVEEEFDRNIVTDAYIKEISSLT